MDLNTIFEGSLEGSLRLRGTRIGIDIIVDAYHRGLSPEQVVHRLACGMSAFQTRVVTLEAPDAAEFDDAGELAVRRVRAGGWHGRPLAPRAARMAALHHETAVIPDSESNSICQ